LKKSIGKEEEHTVVVAVCCQKQGKKLSCCQDCSLKFLHKLFKFLKNLLRKNIEEADLSLLLKYWSQIDVLNRWRGAAHAQHIEMDTNIL
jgi:hypothetical protein